MSEQYGNTPRKILKYLQYYDDEWRKYFWNKIVLKYEHNINWNGLSSNPNITWDIIKENLDKPWDWRRLSYNPNITMDIIKDNTEQPWDWYGLSLNPNINWDIINETLNGPRDWFELSCNPFKKDKEIFMDRKLREHISAFKIQTYWRCANYNPNYLLCKKRLMREYDEYGIEDKLFTGDILCHVLHSEITDDF